MGNSKSCDALQLSCLMCNVEPDALPAKTRERASQYISVNSVPPPIAVVEVRQVFSSTPMVALDDMGRGDKNHTHGRSAASRSSASMLIDRMGELLSAAPTFFQGSSADVRNGRDISRIYFWPKDLQVPVAAFKPQPDALVAFVDVDYYVDLNEFLLDHFVPVVMYTFQPSSVAHSKGDYAYTFLRDGSVHYQVAGGSGYSHKIWSFSGDSIMVARKKFGFVVECNAYLIERRYVDENHQVVALIPLKRFVGFAAWVASRVCTIGQLQHLNPVTEGDFLRMETKTSEGLMVHTGKVGCHAVTTLPKEMDDRIAMLASVLPKQVTNGAIARIVGAFEAGSLEPVHAFYNSGGGRTPASIAVVDPYVRSYQYVEHPSDIDVECKLAMVSFMPPFIDAAFVPADCRNNDERAVRERVTKLANSTAMTSFLSSCVDDFLTILFNGKENTLLPVDEGEVYARQNRPTQRRILDASQWEDRQDVTKSFIKREAYQEPNDPRIISTINGRDKREYSMYTYAAADFIKQQPWYAFGKTPAQIAARVAEVCTGATSVIMTDFSRMDGRVSQVARELEQRFMVGAFAKEHREEILRLLRTQFGLAGRTRHGVPYETLLARLSGSPETSLFNTLLNVFVAFVNFRMTPTDEGYMTPLEAFSRLGIYAGDDGLTADASPRIYERAATQVGQFLTAETKLRGMEGVTFLSRHYGPNVWWGDAESICVAPRLLSKFHVTVRMQSNVNAKDKLWDKAYAVWLTDANTPIIGPFVQRVLDLADRKPAEFKNLSGAWNVAAKEDQYPNAKQEWMLALVSDLLPEFPFAAFDEWLSATKSLDDLLAMPCWIERKDARNTKNQTLLVDDALYPPVPKMGKTVKLPDGKPCDEGEWQTKKSKASTRSDRGRTPTMYKDKEPAEEKSSKAPGKTPNGAQESGANKPQGAKPSTKQPAAKA